MKKIKDCVNWFFRLIDYVVETLEKSYGKIFILIIFMVFNNIFLNNFFMFYVNEDWGLWLYMGLLVAIVIIQVFRKIFK